MAFVTGRTFSFAFPILSSLRGNFYFSVQNGAALYEMPSQKLIEKNYVKSFSLKDIEAIFSKERFGFLVESGKEEKDVCYYNPKNFGAKELEYIEYRKEISPERWQAVESLQEITLAEFSVGKFFAAKDKAQEIAEKIHKIQNQKFNIVIIQDPFHPGGYLAHVNQFKASKGKILEKLKNKVPLKIAAGDDLNDLEMLEGAEIKIVIKNSPDTLLRKADILAEGPEKGGIINALQEAIERCSKNEVE